MENRAPLLAAHYADKAHDFFQAMKLLDEYDFAKHRASIGLLAVHSAISLNDAISAGIRGKQSKAEDHSAAIQELQRICNELRIAEVRGIHHFSGLLSRKSHIAYGNERITDDEIKLAVVRAERFANWAYNYFREVLGGRRA